MSMEGWIGFIFKFRCIALELRIHRKKVRNAY